MKKKRILLFTNWFSFLLFVGPYEIFVRELIAVDGVDASEILLIDSLGCPTDVFIMGAMRKVGESGQAIEAPFDAFKFPTSEIVQFRALVTPCLPSCQPVKCDVSNADGLTRELDSFGRRRRRRRRETKEENKSKQMEDDPVVVVQSLSVSDRFGFHRGERKLEDFSSDVSKVVVGPTSKDGAQFLVIRNIANMLFSVFLETKASEQLGFSCVNVVGTVAACSVFLLAQVALILAWSCLWLKRHKKYKEKHSWPQPQPQLQPQRRHPHDHQIYRANGDGCIATNSSSTNSGASRSVEFMYTSKQF